MPCRWHATILGTWRQSQADVARFQPQCPCPRDNSHNPARHDSLYKYLMNGGLPPHATMAHSPTAPAEDETSPHLVIQVLKVVKYQCVHGTPHKKTASRDSLYSVVLPDEKAEHAYLRSRWDECLKDAHGCHDNPDSPSRCGNSHITRLGLHPPNGA